MRPNQCRPEQLRKCVVHMLPLLHLSNRLLNPYRLRRHLIRPLMLVTFLSPSWRICTRPTAAWMLLARIREVSRVDLGAFLLSRPQTRPFPFRDSARLSPPLRHPAPLLSSHNPHLPFRISLLRKGHRAVHTMSVPLLHTWLSRSRHISP